MPGVLRCYGGEQRRSCKYGWCDGQRWGSNLTPKIVTEREREMLWLRKETEEMREERIWWRVLFNSFSFGAVELEGIFPHPCLCLLQTGVQMSDRGGGGGGGSGLELCVVFTVARQHTQKAGQNVFILPEVKIKSNRMTFLHGNKKDIILEQISRYITFF